jgi:hypothetical protein
MEKASENFKKAIEAELNRRALEDKLFKESLNKPHKDIDQCIIYILKTVQASGAQGFEDNEIFNMAVHYYDEDTIDINKPIKATVVVNHHVKLTEEEKATAKTQAIQDVIDEEKAKMRKKKKSSKTPEQESGTLFE